MENKQKLMTERTQLFTDIYDGRIPRRYPGCQAFRLNLPFSMPGCPGQDNILWKALKKHLTRFAAGLLDAYPMGFLILLKMQILGSSFIMGSNGFMQHPEVVPMEPDEYDELIASPIDFYLEKFSPRLFELDTDPVTRSLVFSAA